MSNTTCNFSDPVHVFGLEFRKVIINTLTPIYFVLGLSGRIIGLFSIYQESKSERAYLYQIFILLSECLEIITLTIFLFFTYSWSGLDSEGVQWFRECYSCMWFTAYFVNPLTNTFLNSTLLLTLAMTIDRIIGLARPMVYAKLNQNKIRWSAFAGCLVLGALTSLVWAFTKALDAGNENKIISVPKTAIINNLIEINYIFRITAAVSMFCCNFFLAYAYHKRMKKKFKLQNQNQQEHAISDVSKNMFKMAMVQSILNTLAVFTMVAADIIGHVAPEFAKCYGVIMATTVDLVMEIADILEFYLMLIISYRFRKMVEKTLKKLISPFKNQVTTMT